MSFTEFTHLTFTKTMFSDKHFYFYTCTELVGSFYKSDSDVHPTCYRKVKSPPPHRILITLDTLSTLVPCFVDHTSIHFSIDRPYELF